MKTFTDILNIIRNKPEAVYVTLGKFGHLALAGVFWLILARILVPNSYGQINYLVSIGLLISIACTLGLRSTVGTYYPKEGKDILLKESITAVFLVSISAGFLVGFLWNMLVGFLIISVSLFEITIYIQLGRREYKKYAILWVGRMSATIGLGVLLFYWFGIGGILVGYAIPAILFSALGLRYLSFNFPDFQEVKAKSWFAKRSMGVDLAESSTWLLDKIVIGSFFGLASLGLYNLAFQMFMAIRVLARALFDYLLPEKSSGAKTEKVESLGVKVSLLLSVGLFS